MKILVLLCFLTAAANGAVFQTDGSQSRVQSALNSARDGDTVLIPVGSFDWSAQVTAKGGVTVQGGGFTKTKVNNTRVSNAYSGNSALVINTDATETSRVTQIGFTGCWSVKINGSPASAPFRIDNCTFDCGTQDGIMVEFNGNGSGLVDHCTVSEGGAAEPLHNNGTGANSTAGWTDDLVPGSPNMVFVENCTFSHQPANDAYFAGSKVIESYYGARTVIRYNMVNYCAVDAHGNKPPLYGARWNEVYNNIFSVPPNGNQSSMVIMRGGSGVVWGNKFSGGPNKGAGGIQFYSDETANPPLCGPGAGIFVNRRRTPSPFYVWGNDPNLGAVGSGSSNITVGKDFIVSATQPSSMRWWQKSTDTASTTYVYQPYQYPHPLDDGPTNTFGPGAPNPTPTPTPAPHTVKKPHSYWRSPNRPVPH
jgi:hypothetical protein